MYTSCNNDVNRCKTVSYIELNEVYYKHMYKGDEAGVLPKF